MIRLPLFLLLLILPLAVAGHNIGTGVVALILFAQLYQRRASLDVRGMWREHRVPLLASTGYILLVVLSGLLNPARPPSASGSFFFGYLIWCFLPPVVFLAQPPMSERDWDRIKVCAAIVATVFGCVAIAQSIYGFRIVGSKFAAATLRAQGFYSHPLTFAYVCLLFLPLGCASVVRRPKEISSWCIMLGAMAAIYASQSRTVQAISALIVVCNVLYFSTGRIRVALLSVSLLAGVGLWVTDNPLSRKFKLTLAGNYDRQSDYPDDRIAFWRVATDMFLERPVLGHGDNIDTAYRTKYYEARGLGAFERKYEAHNMYLQVAVNGGLIGLGVFLIWLGWTFRRAAQMARFNFGGKVALQTLAALCLAAMTQNAFQDSEVRFGLTLLCTALWLAGKPGGDKAVSEANAVAA